MALSRRRLLIAAFPALLVGRGASARGPQGLEQFALGGPPCAVTGALTPAVARDATYRPGSPERTSLVEPGTPGVPLTFTGTVTGLTCGRIAGARVDVWHADGRGAYDMTGWRYRGHQPTDADGQFRFRTIVPGAAGARAPQIGVHVVVAGKADFATVLFFPGDARNAADARHQPALEFRVLTDGTGQRASFDVVLDL
jgi:protocatechuate 3,4-dioxygenase beta subunit